MQSKAESLIEAVIGTLIGFVISFCAGLVIYPMFGFNVSAGQNFGIILLFTVLSVVRSYLVRRYFNQRLKRLAQSLAEMTH